MFQWFRTLLHSPQAPQGEQTLQATIAQIRTCRGHLVQLMEEARIARQLLIVTEEECTQQLQRTKNVVALREAKTFTIDDRQR